MKAGVGGSVQPLMLARSPQRTEWTLASTLQGWGRQLGPQQPLHHPAGLGPTKSNQQMDLTPSRWAERCGEAGRVYQGLPAPMVY